MGLLDAFNYVPRGASPLMDLLQQRLQGAGNGFDGIPSDRAQYNPAAGGPGLFETMMGPAPAPAAPPPPPLPPSFAQPSRPPSDGPGLGDRLTASLLGFANSGGLGPAVISGIGGLMTGQRMDPAGINQQRAQQTENLTAKWLESRGADPTTIRAAIANPKLLDTLIEEIKVKPIQSLGDGYVWDPKQQKAVRAYTPEEKPPASVQEYNFYRQSVAPGTVPMPFDVWSNTKARAAATNVTTTVNGDGESAFDKEGAKLQAGRFNDLVGEGQQAKQITADMSTLIDLGKSIGTGKSAQVRATMGPYADSLGIPVKGLSDIQAFEAIVNRVAPSLRVKGSGAQSDYELKNFMKSIPSLGSTQEGNEIAKAVMDGLTQNKVLASEIASKALTKEITRKQAEEQLRSLPDPMEPYRNFKASRSTVDNLLQKYGGQ